MMIAKVVISLVSLACGIAVCQLVSKYPNKYGTAEPLEPIWWVIGVVVMVGANLLIYSIGWAWVSIAFLVAILATECFCKIDYHKATVATVSAIPFTVTTIFCLVEEASKNNSPKTRWLVIIPLLALIAIFIVGKFKTMPSGKIAKAKKLLTVWNVVSALFATAAVITLIILFKEVF